MPALNTVIENFQSSQSMCEMQLWSPQQGSIPESFPISVDIDFGPEEICLPSISYELTLTKATLHLSLENADLIRGSKLGETVLDPDIVANVTKSIKDSLETETSAEGRLEIEVSNNILGKATALFKRMVRNSRKTESDYIVESSVRVKRIAPRPKGKWVIVEPLAPHQLIGRYVGLQGATEVGPLCLLTMRGNACKVQLVVTACSDDIIAVPKRRLSNFARTRNKEAVISQLLRKAIESNQVTGITVPPHIGTNDIVLSGGKMEITLEA